MIYEIIMNSLYYIVLLGCLCIACKQIIDIHASIEEDLEKRKRIKKDIYENLITFLSCCLIGAFSIIYHEYLK